MMRRIALLLIALAVCIPFLVSAPSVSAHSWNVIFVPRADPSRPTPVIDGVCDTGEYAVARRTALLYEPTIPRAPAWLYMFSTPKHLYVCAVGLARTLTTIPPYVSIAFDSLHNGGRVPDHDDIRFTLTETGMRQAQRGDASGGFVAAPEITGWLAEVRMRPSTWDAEFMIPLSVIGGGAPSSFVGFNVAHYGLPEPGDDYNWPARSVATIPSTWGDVVWFGVPSGPSEVQLDVERITQGLEIDVTGRTSYELIAGKDTLVRAQVYTLGAVRELTYAACRVQLIATYSSAGIRRPQAGPVETLPMRYQPGVPTVGLARVGFFDGSPTLDCWAPGSVVASPGDYRFELQITLAGSATSQTIPLGTRTFKPTADLRVLIHPFLRPPGHEQYAPAWTRGMTAALLSAMQEFVREWPLRSGVGPVNETGTPIPASGVRYTILPGVSPCNIRSGESIYAAAERCEMDETTLLGRARNAANTRLASNEMRDGRRRDRYDFGFAAQASNQVAGGWCCNSNAMMGAVSEGGGVPAGDTMAHEFAHALGEVKSSSPHWDGMRNHTDTITITLSQNMPLVNLLTRRNVMTPFALMNPGGIGGRVYINEGVEWNSLRQTLLTMSRPTKMDHIAKSGSAANSALFEVAGLIDEADNVSLSYSARIDDQALELTSATPGSPYALVFLDKLGAELGRLPFTPNLKTDDQPHTIAGLYLVAPLPEGSARVEIRRDARLLYGLDFSSTKPSIFNVTSTVTEKSVNLQWEASDADGGKLSYSVYFLPTTEGLPLLVAHGLNDTSYQFLTDLAPATTDGHLIIEASDGYHTSTGASAPFAIASQPPVVGILAPDGVENLLAGRAATLVGFAHDNTVGPLTGAALTWRSNRDGILGTGEQLDVALTPGTHDLTLEVKAPSGLTSATSVQVSVQEDSDRDGLDNGYEASHQCLSVSHFDSDADPDSDWLTSIGEEARGADPCQTDSDTDGLGDGEESYLGSNPLSAQSKPPSDNLYVAHDEIDLGMCPEAPSQTLTVQAGPNTVWTVWTDADWLTVSGGGTGNGQIIVQATCQGLGDALYTAHVFLGSDNGFIHTLHVYLDSPSIVPYIPTFSVLLPHLTKGAEIER